MNKKQPLISIVIPVYKVERYLRTCVDSVLNQAFKDYELILVDDGSPDGCPTICDEYAGNDKYTGNDEYVKVIHKENGGLSDARNAGVLAATGKYILFIDSDDFIANDSLKKISETLNHDSEPDIVFLNALCIYPGNKVNHYGSHFKKETFIGKSKGELLQHLAEIPQFHVSACIKMVRRELIIDNGILFTKGILSEDVDWSMKLYLHAKNFDCCESIHYYYRQQREGSIMLNFSEKRFSDVLFIIKKWIDLSNSRYKEYEDIISHFMYHQYYVLILMYCNKYNKNRRKYKYDLKELSWLLYITKSKKSFLVKIFYQLLGFRILSVALNFYMRVVDEHG